MSYLYLYLCSRYSSVVLFFCFKIEPSIFLNLTFGHDVTVTCTEVWSGANERRLINDLGLYDARVYNKLERPVVNESESLVVSFSLVLQQIIGVVSRAACLVEDLRRRNLLTR